ncbi:hypothetical protein GKODMF_07420 [Candidatus Electrothrix gigas]
MRLVDFSVKIYRGKELSSGHVVMRHNAQYALRLSNSGATRCDAEVEIDGKPVGSWRVYPRNDIFIQRPIHDRRSFTFYKLGTREAQEAKLVQSDKLGLISVTFKPEIRSLFHNHRICFFRAGGTGLSGKNQQEFSTVKPLDYDETKFVQINLRLVCETDEPRPLTPVSTPIPPPLL